MEKKTTIIALLTMLFLLGACSALKAGDDSEVIISTKYGNISKDDLYKEVANTERGNELIQKLAYMQILKGKYDVSEQEVEERMVEIKEQAGDKGDLTMFLQQQGFNDEDELRNYVEQSLYFFKATSEGLNVTDKQIRDYYEQNIDLYTEVRVSHILVDKEPIAKEIREELEKGTDFAKLAKKESSDTVSAEQGGDLGYLTGQSQELDPTFLASAMKLKKDEVSEPVKTVFGYHIIKVTDRKEKPLSEVKESIKRALMEKDALPIQEVLTELNKEIEIEEGLFIDAFKEAE